MQMWFYVMRIVALVFGILISFGDNIQAVTREGTEVAWLLGIAVLVFVDYISAGIVILAFLYAKSDRTSAFSSEADKARTIDVLPYVNGGSIIRRDNLVVSGHLVGRVMNAQGVLPMDGISGMGAEQYDTFTELSSS